MAGSDVGHFSFNEDRMVWVMVPPFMEKQGLSAIASRFQQKKLVLLLLLKN
jgi:hypothetical protein